MDSSIERFEQLERRLARAERDMTGLRRRLRATWSLAFIGTLGAFVLGLNPEARAQFGVTLSSLNNRLALVENKTASMSAITDANTNQPTVRFTGVNVQIVSGSGSTDGAINGRGNLIVGYNELRGNRTDVRTGSHNLIGGALNSYSSYGGLAAGVYNTITGPFASVSGGYNNTASADSASVSGGGSNTASAFLASVSGGQNNTASAQSASVSGGRENEAAGYVSSVSGGYSRDIGSDGSHNWRAGTYFQYN